MQETMEEKRPTDRIIEKIKPYIESKGFLYKKSQKDFVQKFALGRQRFSLTFDGRGGLATVNCGFFIYFDELIKLFGKIFEKETGDWNFQVGVNSLKGIDTVFDGNVGFLFDDKFGNMPLSEKSNYSSYDVHPEHKIKHGSDFIIKAFDLYAENHFNNIDNYETLHEAFIHAIKVRSGKLPQTTPFLNLNLRYNEENLLYYSLILALCLNKDTTAINELAEDIYKRYVVNVDEIKGNVKKIYDFDKIENLKNRLL